MKQTRQTTASPRILTTIAGAIIYMAVIIPTLTGCGGRSVKSLYQEAINAAAKAQWSKVENLSSKMISVDESHIQGRVLHGISLFELQKPEKAATELSRAAEAAPENFAAQYFYGWVLFETGQYAEALRPLKKAYSIRKDQPDLLILLATCCLEQNLQEGLRYLQGLRRFETYREDPTVYNDMALLWLGQGQSAYGRAKELLLEAYRKEPRHPVVLQNLAVIHDRYLQDYRQAVKYYQLCLKESRRRHDYKREAKVKRRMRQVVNNMRAAAGNERP